MLSSHTWGGITANRNQKYQWFRDDGWYSDPRLTTGPVPGPGDATVDNIDGYVRTGPRMHHANMGVNADNAPFCASVFYRTIFMGQRESDSGGGNLSSYTHKGTLLMAPMGLGFLMTTGMIGDVRVLFRPSAGDGMEPDKQTYTDGYQGGATTLTECKRAGGFTAKVMTHGIWDAYGNYSDEMAFATWQPTGWRGRALQSTYNYRNLPSLIRCTYNDTSNASGEEEYNLWYTKPRVKIRAGRPLFKTQRILGARAIVSDTFSRFDFSTLPLEVGYARYAHVDGYNVLYGDGSARWRGDPQQNIMWGLARSSNTSTSRGMAENLSVNSVTHYSLTRDAFYYTAGQEIHCNLPEGASADVWHLFDAAAGIDP